MRKKGITTVLFPSHDQVEITKEYKHIWVIGGAKVFETALKDDRCDKIYLTHIGKEYRVIVTGKPPVC